MPFRAKLDNLNLKYPTPPLSSPCTTIATFPIATPSYYTTGLHQHDPPSPTKPPPPLPNTHTPPFECRKIVPHSLCISRNHPPSLQSITNPLLATSGRWIDVCMRKSWNHPPPLLSIKIPQGSDWVRYAVVLWDFRVGKRLGKPKMVVGGWGWSSHRCWGRGGWWWERWRRKGGIRSRG